MAVRYKHWKLVLDHESQSYERWERQDKTEYQEQ